MEDVHKFRTIYKLKSIYRLNSVGDRKESTAEHTWSAVMLADYILTKYTLNIDKMKVFELLLFHDLVEIHAGDTPMQPGMKITKEEKRRLEDNAAKKLAGELPIVLSKKYESLYLEYEDMKTIESKFAHAIDALDSQIHELDYKNDWKGWSEEFLRDKKEKYFESFPELLAIFNDLIDYMNDNGYFSK